MDKPMPKAAQFFSPPGTAPWGRHNNPESTSGDLPTPCTVPDSPHPSWESSSRIWHR